jgi:D-cysteine desulfhydrase family pyridoxal phosphate-dependent enzyme
MPQTAPSIAELEEWLDSRPRFRLAHLPTPFEPAGVGIAGHRVFVKRDDCTGLALGGNKTRKLEFTIGDALQKGADTLLTASGVQSNHVRQTAAAAAMSGLAFHAAVAVAPLLSTYPASYLDSGNMLLDHIYGAQLHLAEAESLLEEKAEEIEAALRSQGASVYRIPLGASDGIGSLGYVGCALEILAQARANNADISHIFVPTGSGGTQAGLIAGFQLAGSDIEVIGLSVSDPAPLKVEKVETSLADIARVIGRAEPFPSAAIRVFDAFAGDGYAVPTQQANDAIIEAARTCGLLLDHVYTGKAWAGMQSLLVNGQLANVRDVAFIHTGGQAGLFAHPRLLFQTEHQAPDFARLYGAVS